ncbi:unnamed protein product [Paramecium pentaurelia]|uniref:RING-CH-type domain-containing protein n=1 Tax=Paramecium pentaurelia TaxID=43138 RepID=A0A8S1SMN5_9CILI|nr:unnamed protein product [Paramecium pentaurelia]
MSFNPNMSEIRLTNQSPNRNFNPMNSSVQFIPDLILDNQPDEQISPRKEIIKKGILKTFYYQDVKRRKLIGCNIYVNEMNEQQLQLSKRGMTCRICMNEEETSRFIMPCACKGSLQYIHEECLKLWILQKNGIEDVFKDRIKCELCSQKFRMRMQLHNHFQKSRFWDVPKHQKICWLIQLFFIFAIISSIAVLFIQFGLSNIGVDAVMTLLIVLCFILIVYLVASFIAFHQVEMIENWTISNYRPRRDTKQGSFFQLQSQMGQSVTGSPIAKKKTAIIHPNGITNLQVIQVNQLMTSTNISEQ